MRFVCACIAAVSLFSPAYAADTRVLFIGNSFVSVNPEIAVGCENRGGGWRGQSGAVLSPVGAAWRKVSQTHPEIELYGGDGIHPSRQGACLAACVFYCALFRKSVMNADTQGIPAAQAAILQKTAQEAVFGGK